METIIYTVQDMEYTWNSEKHLAKLKKHGLDFADVEKVFSGHTLSDPDHRFEYGEERFITVGWLEDTVVVIAHTETEDEIHVISMRKAERQQEISDSPSGLSV